jgi:ABC-type nitrate/sulfonate/bicarbonate transport system permease component
MRLVEKCDLYLGHTLVTLYETLGGFALVVVIGVLAAALIVGIPAVRDVVMPLLLIAQLVPTVAIAPILLIWFGYGPLQRRRDLVDAIEYVARVQEGVSSCRLRSSWISLERCSQPPDP